MAFDPNNPPSLIASGIGGTQGLKHFGWKGLMPISEVITAGYVRTARKLAMRPGDAVRYVDADNNPHYLVVDAIDPDTGWGTLAFPPTDAAAFPIDENPDGEIFLVTYVDGEQRRVAPEDLTLLSGAGLVVNQKHYTVGTPDGEYVYDGSTTIFTIPHIEGQILVYNDDGTLLIPDVDYTDNGSTSITLTSPATNGEVMSLYALSAASAATIVVGDVTSGPVASVTNVGTANAAVFDFVLQPGEQGDPGAQGDQGDPGDQGDQGDPGWSPVFAIVNDGTRRVLQVSDWVGGAGTKPATGEYVGASGLTGTIGSAVDIRGPTGAAGAGTGDMTAAVYDPTAKVADAFDMTNMVEGTTQKILTATERTKIGHLTVTAATDLDTIRARVLDLDAAVVLRGAWAANAGTFPGGGTAQAGSSYIVSIAGTVGGIDFAVNDRVVAILDNASTTTYAANWLKLDYTDQVLSVAGLTGAISAAGLKTALAIPTLESLEALSLAQGDVIYATAADTLTRLPKGTALQSLRMNAGATAPEWATPSGGGWASLGSLATTSGTSATFSSIPDTYAELALMFNGVSQSSASITFSIEISNNNGGAWSTARGVSNLTAATATLRGLILFEDYAADIGYMFGGLANIGTTLELSSPLTAISYVTTHTGGIDAIRMSIAGATLDAGSVTLYGR